MPSTQFVRVNGLRLAYREWPGRPGAPPVVCLPHLTGHKGSFEWLAAALGPDYQVYALDLRGRGESDRPAEGYGFAYHAADVLGFAAALGLERFALVGHSFGATTAVYLASIRPQVVTALALLDGGADPREETLKAMYPTIHRLSETYASLEAYLEAMRAVPYFQPWDDSLERYFRDDAEVLADGRARSRSSAEAIRRDLDQHFLYSLCLHFPAVRCPALLARPALGLLGERGHVFSPREAEAIVAHIPRGQLVHVPGVNHYTLVLRADSPAPGLVRQFLDETAGGLMAPAAGG
jgi:pimeloyl-ACP methyl ester carboxylesterase